MALHLLNFRVSPVSAFIVCCLVFLRTASAQSNVIVIVADDAGYGDFGFMDGISGTTSVVPTPNLDALATRGLRFSRAYAGQSCQPTRAALVTGGYQNRIGNEVVGNNLTSANGVFEGIPLETDTIWDRMKGLGYATGAVGKWHLGQIEDTPTRLGNRPQNQGVDEFYGIWHGSRGYTVGGLGGNPTQALRAAIVQPDGTITDNVIESQHAGEYITNTFGDYGADFISDHHDGANPFFLYQSFTAPHTPLHNSPDFNDPRLTGLTGIQKQYASMMLTMDNEIGRMMDRLADPNQDGNTSDSIVDDTLVVFINDNGGADQFSSSPNGADNGFLRRGKGSPYEGGIRVPMIMAGAGISPSVHGTTYDRPVHAIDVLPTAVAAAGGALAPGASGIDGVNLLPYVNGTNGDNPHDVLVHRHRTNFAVVKNDWKLVHASGNPSQNYQLYNLANDVSETTNLAATNPTIVAELLRDLTDHEVTFDKQRFAILGRTAEETINLFDHFTFNPKQGGPGGEVVIIGGSEGNGDFSAGGSTPAGAQTFDMTPNWFNAQGSETINFTQDSQMNGSTDPSSVLRGGMPFRDRVQINDTAYTITEAGEEFSISYDFGAGGPGGRWNNEEDMRTFIFTTSTAVDGSTVVSDITEVAADVYSVDRATDGQWTQHEATAFYTSTAADIGKTIYFGMEFKDGDTSDGDLFPRIDIVRLSVTDPSGSSVAVTNWSEANRWFESGTSDLETLFSSDAFAGAVLEFPTKDFSYISHNDMVRMTGQTFMLNKIVLSGDFNGADSQFARIEGNELLFTNNLVGVGPQIEVSATNSGGPSFSYEIDLDLVLYDDLTFSGNGDSPLIVNGSIRDYFASQGINKSGTSRVTLTGANTYSGNTNVLGGTLALSGNASISNSQVVLVAAGATLDVADLTNGFAVVAGQTLRGDGVVFGDVGATSGATISPGAGIGVLTINGDYSQDPGSTLAIEIAGVANHDQLEVTGTVGLFAADLSVSLAAEYYPMIGDSFDILDFSAIFGSFNTIDLPNLIGGLSWDTTLLGITGVISILGSDLGDFNGDGQWDCGDIDALVAEIAAGTNDSVFDMNGDGNVDMQDVTDSDLGWLVVGGLNNPSETGGFPFLSGDGNLDGSVDASDFNIWNSSKFTSTAAWCGGDYNADGSVDASDFNVWNGNKFRSSFDAQVVPEPSSVSLAVATLVCAFGLTNRMRRRYSIENVTTNGR